jgi:uncharacterized membrane protein YgcG
MRTAFVALTLFAASLLHAQERTLLWKALDVTAKLESDGTLRISERHRMLFDGDWNGGERVFRVEPGQQLELVGMSRMRSGKPRAMAEAGGSGIGLHEYRFDGQTQTLRWRAREASAPPFRNAERVYVIEYLLRNVVVREGESYVLRHDFAFTDRPGPIEAFSAKLELDPAWQAPADFVPLFERTNLPPGESAVLTVQLQWTGEGQPQYVVVPPPPPPAPVQIASRPVAPPPPPASIPAKLVAVAAFGFAVMLLMMIFLRRERALGRFAPRPNVTPTWLEGHLLVHRAEVVGAAWDGVTGAGEVAALIAIMTAEGKIENVPGAPRLRLLVPRHSLSEYERGFVDALFIAGDEIDPATLRRYYRETGFHPERTIAAPLHAAAFRLVGSPPRGSWAMGCLVFAAAVFVFPLMAGAFLVSVLIAAMYRNSFLGRATAMAIPIPILIAGLLHGVINDSILWLLANLAAGLVLLAVALGVAAWKGTEFELRNLLDFRAARDFLLQCIVRGDAQVDPRWIPYMLAFGLVPDDRWSVMAERPYVPETFDDGRQPSLWSPPPSPSPSFTSSPSSSSSSASPSSSSPSSWPSSSPPASASVFQAGGGRFGGAGATGSWASIQTFASTVAATPRRSVSSSSSSSSSGSSRRSSGSGWSWSSSGSSGSSSSSRSSSSSSSSSSSGSRSSSSSGSRSSGGGGSRSGGGGGGGW